jgi:hypothetical protein
LAWFGGACDGLFEPFDLFLARVRLLLRLLRLLRRCGRFCSGAP